MSVEVDDPPDLVEYLDPKSRGVGRRQADPLDPLTSVALSRTTGHVMTVRRGAEPRCRICRGSQNPQRSGMYELSPVAIA